MQTKNFSNSSSKLTVAGFGSIPLRAGDLTPFGGEVGTSGRMIWALHRDADGHVTGRELIYGGDGGRGGYGFTRGGRKSLFRSTGTAACRPRLVLVDGPMQAITRAALDGPDIAAGTTYAAPGGPWTRAASEALDALLRASPPTVAIFAFAQAHDGCCQSAELCRAVLARLPAMTIDILVPPAGGWVEALRASRRAPLAA